MALFVSPSFHPSTKKLINDAIMNNDFLKKLEHQHMREMVDCMYEKVYTEGQVVIQEGKPGHYLYVLAGQLNRICGALMGLPLSVFCDLVHFTKPIGTETKLRKSN